MLHVGRRPKLSDKEWSEAVEALKEADLRGKFATQITTSKHFYDVTAQNYVKENCQDLGLKFVNILYFSHIRKMCDGMSRKKPLPDAFFTG